MPEYETVFDKELNVELMEKQDDKPLLDFILESWYSLEIIEGIKILDWKYTDKKSEIDVNKYIFKRNRNVKQKERFEWKYIDESRLGLLTVRVQLTVNTIDPKTNEEVTKQQIITKSMLIPIQDEDGCYCLSGQQVYMIFQLVEKSTYTAANSVILKSLMPFATRRYQINVRDINDVEFTLPYYTIELFKKDVEVMLIYATKGLNSAIQFALEAPYLVINFVDDITDEDKEDLTTLIFQISSKLYLKVNKQLFDQFVYVRSVVGGILRISTNRLTLDKIDDKELWLKKLGGSNVEKGKNLLRSAKRLLDQTTGRILRLDIYQKHDVYSLIRWMMQEYNDLRMKDNMNLRNKRLRSNEIPSCLMTQEFSIRLNRLMSYGKKADLDNYREVFSFSGDILIQKMHSSGILRYNDVINDMTFFSKFKFTKLFMVNKNLSNCGEHLLCSRHAQYEYAG
jgi:hypothetical protein